MAGMCQEKPTGDMFSVGVGDKDNDSHSDTEHKNTQQG